MTGWWLDRGYALLKRDGESWRDRVVVAYTPESTNALRRLALIDLVKLRLQFTGLAGEREGGHSYTAADHDAEETRILQGVRAGLVTV